MLDSNKINITSEPRGNGGKLYVLASDVIQRNMIMKKAFLIAILFSNVIFSEEKFIKIPESTISDLDYKNSLLENQKNYLLKENKEIERRAGAERDKRMSNGVAEIYKKTGIITEEDPRIAALVTINTTLEARVREQEMRIREYEQKIDAYRNSANPTDFHGIASIREELGSSQNRSSGRTLAELEVISNLLGSRSESVISNADTQGMLLQQTQIATTLAEKVAQQQQELEQQQASLGQATARVTDTQVMLLQQTQIATTLAEKVEQQQQELQQQQTSLTAAHEAELALREQQQQEAHQEEILQQQTRLTTAYEAELAKLSETHQVALQKLDEEKKQQKEAHQEELLQLEKTHGAALALRLKQQEELALRLKQQQEAHQEDILQQQTRLTTAHDSKLEELRDAHQQALQQQQTSLTTEHGAALALLLKQQEELALRLKQQQEAHQEELLLATANLQKLDKEKNQLKENFELVKSETNLNRDQLRLEIEKELYKNIEIFKNSLMVGLNQKRYDIKEITDRIEILSFRAPSKQVKNLIKQNNQKQDVHKERKVQQDREDRIIVLNKQIEKLEQDINNNNSQKRNNDINMKIKEYRQELGELNELSKPTFINFFDNGPKSKDQKKDIDELKIDLEQLKIASVEITKKLSLLEEIDKVLTSSLKIREKKEDKEKNDFDAQASHLRSISKTKIINNDRDFLDD